LPNFSKWLKIYNRFHLKAIEGGLISFVLKT